MAKVIEIEFAGVDRFNRPTFVSKEKMPVRHIYDGITENYRYYCDTEHLFDYNATEKEVLDAYRSDPDKVKSIIHKGTRFGAEPSGEHVNVKIVGL